jgi:hypothetical protein
VAFLAGFLIGGGTLLYGLRHDWPTLKIFLVTLALCVVAGTVIGLVEHNGN